MKISICKDTITLAKLEEAKEFAQDNSWIGKDEIKDCAGKVLKKLHGDTVYISDVISTGKLEVTIDHCIDMCVYAHDVIVRYWLYQERIAVICMNLTDCMDDRPHGFVRSFGQDKELPEII